MVRKTDLACGKVIVVNTMVSKLELEIRQEIKGLSMKGITRIIHSFRLCTPNVNTRSKHLPDAHQNTAYSESNF